MAIVHGPIHQLSLRVVAQQTHDRELGGTSDFRHPGPRPRGLFIREMGDVRTSLLLVVVEVNCPVHLGHLKGKEVAHLVSRKSLRSQESSTLVDPNPKILEGKRGSV